MDNNKYWFKFSPEDFLGGTYNMSSVAVGAYIRMICYHFKYGKIPVRKAMIAACCEPEEWEAAKDEVLEKFEERDGFLFNIRIEREAAETDQRVSSRSVGASRAAAKRWQKKKEPTKKEAAPPVAPRKTRLDGQVEKILKAFDIKSDVAMIGSEALTMFQSNPQFLEDDAIATIAANAKAWAKQDWITNVTPTLIARRISDIYHYRPNQNHHKPNEANKKRNNGSNGSATSGTLNERAVSSYANF